jgi:2-polyprenyl-3-methyl-5-hydroxy-6-metoxy-1,4-benzoquinol methylase
MFIKIGDFKLTEYNGIQELAAFNLHTDVFKIAEEFLKEGMNVLDFGCGQGAFSQRLVDAGMIVDVCDLDIAQVKANVNRKYQLDLNSADIKSSITAKYDVIIAMEIIEHLQNPWKYLSDCTSLLKNGGIIVLSTPNISNSLSRLRHFMRGTLLAYEKSDLAHGHITPLSFVQLENMFRFDGLEILKKGWAGPVPLFHFYNISRFSFLRNTILPLLYPFIGGPKKGRSLVYVLRKASSMNPS